MFYGLVYDATLVGVWIAVFYCLVYDTTLVTNIDAAVQQYCRIGRRYLVPRLTRALLLHVEALKYYTL